MMKFLVFGLLVASCLALVDLARSQETASKNLYQLLPADDIGAAAALKSGKAKIILKLAKQYPFLTLDPVFDVLSAEIKSTAVTNKGDFSADNYYRFNLRLHAPHHPEPSVTFKVYIGVRNYDSHKQYLNPLVDQSGSSNEIYRYLSPADQRNGGFKLISVDDIGLKTGLDLVHGAVWSQLKLHGLSRRNATSSAKDDFLVECVLFKESNETNSPIFDTDYVAIVNLTAGAVISDPSQKFYFVVHIKAHHSLAQVDYELTEFAGLGEKHLHALDLHQHRDTSEVSYLGDFEKIVNTPHFYAAFEAVKSDFVKVASRLFARLTITEKDVFHLTSGVVRYQDNKGDLDAPIVRLIATDVKIFEPFLPELKILPRSFLNTSAVLQESIFPANHSATYKLLAVNHCILTELDKCDVEY